MMSRLCISRAARNGLELDYSRENRVIDHDQSASMEKKKQEGYF